MTSFGMKTVRNNDSSEYRPIPKINGYKNELCTDIFVLFGSLVYSVFQDITFSTFNLIIAIVDVYW